MPPEKVDEIIELLKSGMKQKDISVKIGVDVSTVSQIGCKNKLRRYSTQRSYLEKNKHLITDISTTVCQYCGR